MADFILEQIRQGFRQDTNQNPLPVILGDNDGNLPDPDVPGNVLVRYVVSNNLFIPFSVGAPSSQQNLKVGDPVELELDRYDNLRIAGLDTGAAVASGYSPATNIAVTTKTKQQDMATLLPIPTDPPSAIIKLKGWNPIIDGVYTEFIGQIDLASLIPGAGDQAWIVFGVDDTFAVVADTSTPVDLSDFLDSEIAINEAITALGTNVTYSWAILLSNAQATITQTDFDNGKDLRQVVNTYIAGTAGNVTGPGSSTDRAIATYNGTDGRTLRDNPNATIGATGIGTFAGLVSNGSVTQIIGGNPATILNSSGNLQVRVDNDSGFIALGQNPAAAGSLRLPYASEVRFRNQANSADVTVFWVNSGNQLRIGNTTNPDGTSIYSGTSQTTVLYIPGSTANAAITINAQPGVIINNNGQTNATANYFQVKGASGAALFNVYGNSRESISVGALDTTTGVLMTVVGNADAKQLVVRGFSSQTANLQEWQNSSGTAALAVNSEGGLQQTKMFSSGSSFNFHSLTLNATGAGSPTYVIVTANVVANTVGNLSALAALSSADGRTGNTTISTQIKGLSGRVGFLSATGFTTSIALATAIEATSPFISNSGGTIAVTNIYGIRIVNQGTGGAAGVTFTNVVGLNIEDQTNGTNLFAIRTNAGNIVFNEGGDANTDVRMEGDTRTHLYFLDASADFVGINQSAPAARFHITESTLGNEVMRISSEATNDDPNEGVYQFRVATTDATVTTLHTFTVPATMTYYIHAIVTARRTGGTAGTAEDGATYEFAGTYKNVAGTATLIGAVTAIHTAEDQAGWNATFDVTGATVRVRITGAVDNNITWHLTARVYQVGS